MPFFDAKYGPVYYEVHGEGMPILFTHGASWNHRLWDPQIEQLKDRYKVIVWDVRGHGKTKSNGEVHGEVFVQDLIDLLDHLSIESIVLCGLSMGGMISMQTAIKYPTRVRGLIVIGAPCTFRFNRYEQLIMPMHRFVFSYLPINAFAKAQGVYFSQFNPSNKYFIEEAVQSLTLKDWTRIWLALTQMDCRDGLESIGCDTLVLIGEHDLIIRHQQKHISRAIPGSRLEVIPKAGHATNRDNPKRVNELIEEYLQMNTEKRLG
ncbi:alpha/beta fold hydrolase [Alteribacter aurantiacus]|uniref:alpha/beta fold hydrolase n=1 Tax=Alteribacter aurantiacus TaxID=254410 RepID=UPI0004142A67|nr:alpha/beta hydrolase [Alteribacter aurantiacus]